MSPTDSSSSLETWELWYPAAAATGLLFARSRIDAASRIWVHSAPDVLAVTVRDKAERVIARADSLRRRGEQFPMTLLTLEGDHLTREDRFPTEADLGNLVILSGGEACRLVAWWNAPDGSEWRWGVELYNHR